jgi:hypothetical protein
VRAKKIALSQWLRAKRLGAPRSNMNRPIPDTRSSIGASGAKPRIIRRIKSSG